ncbi:MAG: DUF1007 family protein [Alphaproteobacteria bacterium]|nr:DUF1007 family protein [Alphaproteobacteria bacterium]
MQRVLFILLTAGVCFAPASAFAHPHVWIDMRSSVNFEAGGAVDALGVSWTFDEFYTQFATDGIDKNKNGKFDANELQDLANTYAKNLKEYRYFMFVETDGKLIDTGAPTNARASVDKGQLTFAFRLPLMKAVDPAAVKLSYSSFDPTYYIDIAPVAANSVMFTGAAPKACSFALRKVDTTKPGALNISQSVKMTTPVNDVLNATSAAVVEITCPVSKAK